MRTSGLILIIFLICTGCKRTDEKITVKELHSREYVQWIENPDNGLRIAKQLGNFAFTLQYKPLEYILLLEERNLDIDQATVAKRKQDFEGMQYYTLELKGLPGKGPLKTDIRDQQEYYARIQYYVSEAKNDMHLIDGNDTLSCLLYHFERNYNLTPYNKIVLGFKKIEGEHSKRFIYNDRILGVGPVSLALKSNDLKQVPKLIYN